MLPGDVFDTVLAQYLEVHHKKIMSAGIFSYHTIKPFKIFGLTGDFWTLHLDILLATWIAMAFLLVVILVGRRVLNSELSPISMLYEKIISFFMGLCKDSFPEFNYYYFAFVTTLCFFAAFCSFVGVLPFVEEATRDINTAFALALTSFIYVNYQKIRVHGLRGYLKEFTEPFIVLAPIHIVGELSKITSMSFRLFGNILGGSIILMMIMSLLSHYKAYFLTALYVAVALKLIAHATSLATKKPIINSVLSWTMNGFFLVAWLYIFLGIFEGLIQAFVLTMLTTTYLAIGAQHNESHPPKEHSS